MRAVLSRWLVRFRGPCVTTGVCPTRPLLNMSAHSFDYMLRSVVCPQPKPRKTQMSPCNMCDKLSGHMCIRVRLSVHQSAEWGARGLRLISPWNIFRESSQAWAREEKGAIVVVQMSVIGASENRFTHCGSTETHTKGLPALLDCHRARFTFLKTQGIKRIGPPPPGSVVRYIWLISSSL